MNSIPRDSVRLARGAVAGEGEQDRPRPAALRGHARGDRRDLVRAWWREPTAGPLAASGTRATRPRVRGGRRTLGARLERGGTPGGQTTPSAGTTSPRRSPSTASGRRPRPARATRPRRCRARICSPSCSPITCASTSKDPRVPRATTGSSCRRATPRRRCTPSLKAVGAFDDDDAPVAPEAGLAAAGPSRADARAALGRRRERARSGRGSRSGSGWRWRCGWTASTRNVWVLLGDSEMAEGSVWEAMEATAVPRGRQRDGDPRPQPARTARPDDARLARATCSATAPRRSAGARSRSTGTTSTQIDRAYRDARGRRPADA